MKTATVRQVQHNLSQVLRWVEDGEEVLITRRSRVVGRIVPAKERRPLKWPDFLGRATRIWGKHPQGKPASQIIVEEREESF